MEGLARGLHACPRSGALVWRSPPAHFVSRPQALEPALSIVEKIADERLEFFLDRDFDEAVARASKGMAPPSLLHRYAELHEMGFAHSFELRNASGQLAAGGYGVAVGRVFVTLAVSGEASLRAALMARLECELTRLQFAMHDCLAPVGAPEGFAPLPRNEYFAQLVANSGGGRLGRWQAQSQRSAALTPHVDLRKRAA